MTYYTPFTHKFLHSILSSIDSKDPVVANAWLDTLLDVIDLLPPDVLGHDVLKIAVNKSQSYQPVFARLGACQLIGKLGSRLENNLIQSELLPLSQELSKDEEWAVRASIVAQLPLLAKGIHKTGKMTDAGKENPLAGIFTMLSSLNGDEEEAVRMVCVESASSLLTFLEKDVVRNCMVPLLRCMAERAIQIEDKTLPLIAQHWARICHTTKDCLEASERQWFWNIYRQMGLLDTNNNQGKTEKSMPDIVAHVEQAPKWEIYVDTRHFCAVNLPAMISFIGAEEFSMNLPSLRSLAADPVHAVRRAVSSNILDICRNMGFFGGLVYPTWIQLLLDPFPDVTSAMVPHIGAVIEHLTRLGPQSPFHLEKNIEETCNAVLRCEEQVMRSSSWRLQSDVLAQLAAFPLCVPCQTVQDCLVPRLWHRIFTSRPLPCRVTAAQTLMLCIKSERRYEEREELCDAVVRDLIRASSCHRRLLFLKVCPLLMDLVSRKFFRKHFFIPVVGLASDKVPNVRLRFCSILPLLQRSLRGADIVAERFYFTELDNAVSRLRELEKDRDVRNELDKYLSVLEELKSETPDTDDDDKNKEKEEELEMVVEEEKEKQSSEAESSRRFPLFVNSRDSVPREIGEESIPEKFESLDPSTDDFYRDAGVRLSSAAPEAVASAPTNSSRIPCSPARRNSTATEPVSSKLRLPTPVRTVSNLSNQGIARGVAQVAPNRQLAQEVSTTSPPIRIARKTSAQLANKSRSQENLTLPPKPRPPRPVSMCLGANPITRNRLRASLGAGSTHRITPIREIPTNQDKAPPSGSNRIGGLTPTPTRKLTLASNPVSAAASGATATLTATAATKFVPEAVGQSTAKQVLPPKPQFAQPLKKVATAKVSTTEARLEEAAADMLAALQSTGEAQSKLTKFRKPSTACLPKPTVAPPITALRKGSTANPKAGSCPTSPQSSRPSSPEPIGMQRRSQWRRSAHFGSSYSSGATPTPPPPPPRRSFGLVKTTSSSMNSNNNNNSPAAASQSKLPVFSSKRNGNMTNHPHI